MASYHRVKQGECMVRIAHEYGFRDWKPIYDHAKNAALRQKRPDPNVLFPGDVVFIPDKNDKKEVRGTGAVHEFVVPDGTRGLKVVLEDVAGSPMVGVAYRLTVDGQVHAGVTNASGLIEQEIAVDAEDGSLETQQFVWPVKIGFLTPMEQCPDDGVSGIQARLRNLGYDPGEIDGILGPHTEAAIRAFQEDNPPLVVDGICGPRTRAALRQKYGC